MTYISAITTDDHKNVLVWERGNDGARTKKVYDAPYYFYVASKKGKYKDINGNPLERYDFDDSREFYNARKLLRDRAVDMFESDIRPHYKILSEHYYGAPIGSLNVTFYDIEVDYDKDLGYADVAAYAAPINSVAIHHMHTNRTVVLAVPPDNRQGVTKADMPDDILESCEIFICQDETELLQLLLKEFEDSDVISGWNSDFFDNGYVYERLNQVLFPGAGNRLSLPGSRDPHYVEVERFGKMDERLVIYGRVTLDYLRVYRKFEVTEKPSFALEAIAEEELPHLPKITYEKSLWHLYRDDFEEFIRYNIRDTVILRSLEDKKGYIETAIRMSHMATSLTEDVLGTIKVAETSIVNYCHYEFDVRVPDSKEHEKPKDKYSGATVFDPQVGMHDYVGSVDLASLYPSTMRSLNISPETIVGQFAEKGAAYMAIRESKKTKVTFVDEKTGKQFRASAYKFRAILSDNNWAISGLGTVFRQDKDGVIPSILTTWFAERKQYKKAMYAAEEEGDTEKEAYYNQLQYIKKIQLNSMYGACGNRFFKFYDVRLAESTTLSGREILYHMARKVAETITGNYDMEDDSVVYGDTDSVYFKTYKDNLEDALDTANHVTNKVNESYPQFMREAFFCDEPHSQLMKAEQEIISDRGIFISKKYYVLHIVADDGKVVDFHGNSIDKVKSMGVPIKKTTLPKHIKSELTSFIERLLKRESWDIVGPDVVYYKDKLKYDVDVLLLGLPTGVKKVEEYTDKYNAFKAGSGEKPHLPGHIAASLLWNACLKKYNDTESPRIVSGSKIFKFILTKTIDGRFKSIAVPKEVDRLPEWFVEHFVPIIDKDAQIERLVDKPMKIMVKAAGLKVPTKKKLLFEEGLFG
jgi:DNA polymerase elongation subunit (family B)